MTIRVLPALRAAVFGTVGAGSPKFLHRSFLLLLTGLLILVLAGSAFAASDADFLEPINEMATSSITALTAIVAGLFGLAIMVVGIMFTLVGNMDPRKLWNFFWGAVITIVGPSAVAWAIELLQKKS